MAASALTADEPPAPRPRTYITSGCPAACVATNAGHMRPGSITALMKLGLRTAVDVVSGPASSKSTEDAGCSDRRLASAAPADPAPTTIRSNRLTALAAGANSGRDRGSGAGPADRRSPTRSPQAYRYSTRR